MSNIKYNAEKLHNEADFGQKMPYLRLWLEKMHGIRNSFAYFFKDIIVLYNLYEFQENRDITSISRKQRYNFNVKIEENC